jgi:hypothetical protein
MHLEVLLVVCLRIEELYQYRGNGFRGDHVTLALNYAMLDVGYRLC